MEQTPVADSQAYVEEVVEQALASLFFFCRAICGFDKLTDRFHKDICHELQDYDALRRLWLVPRDHYKSTIVSVAFPLWLLAKDPEERILIGADTATNAQAKLSKIKQIILGSKNIRAFFPQLIPDNIKKTVWSESEILLPRQGAHAEASISTIGAGGAIVGAHFTRIILDDLVTLEASQSTTVMNSAINWVDGVEDLLVEPYENTIDVVGTRWTHSDIYDHIEHHWPAGESQSDRPFYRSFLRSFWVEDGVPLFPELYGGVENAKDFAKRRAEQNYYRWSCNYLNDPTVPEADFNPGDLRYYRWDERKEHMLYEKPPTESTHVASLAGLDLYMTVDPAYSKQRGASKAAIIVSGVLPTGEIFLVQAKKGRWGGQGLIREIKLMVRKYKAYLRALGIEATATQQAFIDDVAKELRNDDLYVPIDSLRPGSIKNKDARIRFHLQKYIGARKLYIAADMHDFERELRHFPLSNEKDLLDAAAYAAEHYWSRASGLTETGKSEAAKRADAVQQREATRNPRTGY